jgi:hypothetical protein
MSRPDPKDIFAKKPGIFSWMRDRAYDFVYYEIGTGLDFVGDLFRGPSGYSQSLHRQTQKAQKRTPQAKPLTKAEQAVFLSILKRKPSEPQMAYWKRKKALLRHPDKKALVTGQKAQNAATRDRAPKIVVEANIAPGAQERRTKSTQQRGQRR